MRATRRYRCGVMLSDWVSSWGGIRAAVEFCDDRVGTLAVHFLCKNSLCGTLEHVALSSHGLLRTADRVWHSGCHGTSYVCNNNGSTIHLLQSTHTASILYSENRWWIGWVIYGGTVLFLLSDAAHTDCSHDEGQDRHLARYRAHVPVIDEAQFRPLTLLKQRPVQLNCLWGHVFNGIRCVYDTFMPCYLTAGGWQLSMP